MFSRKKLRRPATRSAVAIFCCAAWGSAIPSVKLGYEWWGISTTAEQILFAGYRFVLAGLITIILGSIIEKRFMGINRNAMPHVMLIGFFQTTVEYFCFYIGMSYITGTQGSIFNAVSVFVSVILAHFLIVGEQLTVIKSVGCMIGFIGVLISSIGDLEGGFTIMGEGLVILSLAIYGAYCVYIKLIAEIDSPTAITAYQLLFGGVVLVVVAFAMGGRLPDYDFKAIMLLLYMASITSVTFVIWTALLKYNDVSKVAIFGFTIPIFGTLISGVMLGETIISIQNILALAFASAGIFIVNKEN